jgi:hypothetical protein
MGEIHIEIEPGDLMSSDKAMEGRKKLVKLLVSENIGQIVDEGVGGGVMDIFVEVSDEKIEGTIGKIRTLVQNCNIENITTVETAEEELSEGEMEFMAMHDFETFEEAMQDYEGFNIFISMLWQFVETIPEERLHKMLLVAASTSDPELADTFISNLVDIETVIDDAELLKKAEAIAKKTIESSK